MVTIPQRNTTQVASTTAAVPLASTSVSAQSFGASAFRAVSDAADVEVAKVDRRTALRASMSAQKAVDGIWFGEGRTLEGEAFFDWAKNAEESVESAIKDSTAGLSSSQSDIIQADLGRMRQSFSRDVSRRMGPVRKEFHEGGLGLDLVDLSDSAVEHSSDPTASVETLQTGLDKGAIRIAEFATDFPEYVGVDVDLWLEAEIKQYESDLVRRAIDQTMAKGNENLAKEYVEQFGHLMDPESRVAAERDVGQASDLGDISSSFDAISSTSPINVSGSGRQTAEELKKPYTPPDAQVGVWEKQQREMGKKLGWSQDKIEEAVKYTRSRGKEKLRIERAKQASVFEAMDAEVAGTGNLLDLQKARPKAWNHITQDQRDSLVKRAVGMAEGKLNQNDPAEWMGLSLLALDDQDAFLKIMDSRTPISVLTEKHWKEALGLAEDIRSGRTDKLAGLFTEKERIRETASAMKLKGQDEVRFFSVADEAITAEKIRRDLDKLPATDVARILQSLQAEELFDAQGRPVLLDDPLWETTVEDMDLPPAWWVANVGAPALLAENEPLTEFNYKSLYLDRLRRSGTLTQRGKIPPEDLLQTPSVDAGDESPLPYARGGSGPSLDVLDVDSTKEDRLSRLEAAGITGAVADNIAAVGSDTIGEMQTKVAIGLSKIGEKLSKGQDEFNRNFGKNLDALLDSLGLR